MKKLTVIILIAIMAVGCSAKKGADGTTGFTVLRQETYNGRENSGFEKVSSPDALKALYSELGIEELPVTDTLKYDIVAVFMGQKNSGGYSITIEGMRVEGNTTYLKKKETKPDGMATMAITAPYVIVEIPKTEKVVIE